VTPHAAPTTYCRGMPACARASSLLVTGTTALFLFTACASGGRPAGRAAGVGHSVSATAEPSSTTALTSAPPQPSTTMAPPTPTTVGSSAATVAPTTTPPAFATVPQAFAGTVSTVTATDLPSTWRPGCPVGPDRLRLLHLTYWGFDARPHLGTMVVNADVTSDVLKVFATLYAERFPIRQMVPADAYGGNDNAAAVADDTSGFNCRYAVAPGPPRWSVHALGEAIDVNDVENPYVEGATILPPAGAQYLNRSTYQPGMAAPGGQLVSAFASVGWFWGGRWTTSPDYQHFSKTGG
jgi:hypothetical protein